MSRQGSHDTRRLLADAKSIGCGSVAEITQALLAAALDSGPDGCFRVAAQARAAGLADTVIVDRCIPDAARTLGDRWLADTLDFAGVTIGSARLQGLLRHLGRPVPVAGRGRADRWHIVVALPTGIQHTLGPTLMTEQLRRRGLATSLMLGIGPAALRQQLARSPADAVFISALSVERLESLRPFVQEVRAVAPDVPVVIGTTGPVLAEDICAMTGADHATLDMEAALTLCGLTDLSHPAMTEEMIS